MQMTDDEIRKRYKQAENKDAQTVILAELNACTVAKIKEIIGGGPAEPVKKSHALFKELYDEGKSDSEIAAKAGVIPNTVWAWRNKNKLPSNYGAKDKKADQNDKKAVQIIPKPFKMEPEPLPTASEMGATVIEGGYAKNVPLPAWRNGDPVGIITSDLIQAAAITITKPPLGLRPAYVWKAARREEILEAFERFISAQKDIPWQWVSEYRELLESDQI